VICAPCVLSMDVDEAIKEISKEVGLVLKEKQYNHDDFVKETIPLYL